MEEIVIILDSVECDILQIAKLILNEVQMSKFYVTDYAGIRDISWYWILIELHFNYQKKM